MKLNYEALNPRDKAVYDALAEHLFAMDSDVTIPGIDIAGNSWTPDDLVHEAVEAIRRDHPGFFNIPKWRCIYSPSSGTLQIHFLYPLTMKQRDSANAIIEAYADWFIQQNAHLSDYDFALAVFHWLTRNVTYIPLPRPGENGLIDEIENAELHNSVYGVFMHNESRCFGYAAAFSLLMQKRQIPASIVMAQLIGSRHVWCLCQIDGVWCHVDPCWADRRDRYSGEDVDMAAYVFFGMTEEEAVKDLRVDTQLSPRDMPFVPMYHNWPKADLQTNTYYVRKGLLFQEQTYAQILDAIRNALTVEPDDEKDIRISIRFRTREALESFREQHLRGLTSTVRQINARRDHPIRFSSGRINSRFLTCDLFFVPIDA